MAHFERRSMMFKQPCTSKFDGEAQQPVKGHVSEGCRRNKSSKKRCSTASGYKIVLHGDDRISPATRGNQNNDQPAEDKY